MMKKLLLILLCLPLLFTTCKKEDEEPTNSGNNNTGNNSTSIIGQWNIIYQEDDYIDGIDSNGDTIYANETEYFGDINGEAPSYMYLEFLSNGELIITYPSMLEYTTWYLISDKLYINSNEWPFSDGEPNTIILLNNTNLYFAVIIEEFGVIGEQRFFCEKM